MVTWHNRTGFPSASVALMLALLLVISVPVWSRQDEPPQGEPEAEGESEATSSIEASDTDLEAIENLLADDESVLSNPDTYNYDPGTRRDPFRSLVENRESNEQEVGDRPDGLAGLLIDEIVIEGVFELLDGPVAQVQSAREETSYLLRPGDQLWDGDVISISLSEVVFKQVVADPTALKPFREVVKRLNP